MMAASRSAEPRSIRVSAELVRRWADLLHGEGDLDTDYAFRQLVAEPLGHPLTYAAVMTWPSGCRGCPASKDGTWAIASDRTARTLGMVSRCGTAACGRDFGKNGDLWQVTADHPDGGLTARHSSTPARANPRAAEGQVCGGLVPAARQDPAPSTAAVTAQGQRARRPLSTTTGTTPSEVG